MAVEIRKSIDHTFSFTKYENGLVIVPSACTATIRNSSGTTIQTGAATITSGVISYKLLAANAGTVAENYSIEWAYTVGSTVYYVRELFDIVIVEMVNTVSDDDLYTYIPDLRNKLLDISSATTSAGTTATIVDASPVLNDKDFTGGYIEINTGTAIHRSRITVHARSTGTITMSVSLGSASTTGMRYVARQSYQTLINAAYNDHVMRDIRSKVGIAAGYIDGAKVRLLVIYKTLEIYCRAAREVSGDRWDMLTQEYAKMYADTFASYNDAYDTDEDGNISDTENADRPSFSAIRIMR